MRDAATICSRPCDLHLWHFDPETGVWVTCDVALLVFLGHISYGTFYQKCWNLLKNTVSSKFLKHNLSPLSLSVHDHFPGEPGLAGIYWSRRWWRWWWQLEYWSYKSYKSSSQIITTNKPTSSFCIGQMPFLLPNRQGQSTEGQISLPMDLLTPSSPGVFELYLWPLISARYLGGGLPSSHQPSVVTWSII